MKNNIKLKIVSVFVCCISGVVCFGSDSDTVTINQSGRELNFKIALVPLALKPEIRIMAEKFVDEKASIVLSASYGFGDFIQRSGNRNKDLRIMSMGGGISFRFYLPEIRNSCIGLSANFIYYECYNAEPRIFSTYMAPFFFVWLAKGVRISSEELGKIYNYRGHNTQIRVEFGGRIPHKFFGCIMPEFSIMPGIFYSSTVVKMTKYKGVLILSEEYREIHVFPSIDIGFNLLFIVKR